MAVRLRLRREGGKKNPYFRVVAADSRSPRDGRFIEILGVYHPSDQPSHIEIDRERALHWLRNGAQATNQVENLLRIVGVWEEFKPGDRPKRLREKRPITTDEADKRQQPEATADLAPDEPAEAASQATRGGDAPAEQTAAAPEEIEAGNGTPEDATATPVAETEPETAAAGAPGGGTEATDEATGTGASGEPQGDASATPAGEEEEQA